MKKAIAPSKHEADLDAAFASEGISIRDLVATVNETRKGAMRFSTKDGEPIGPDHATRAKTAMFLLELRGLPSKSTGSAAPQAKSIGEALGAPEPEPEDPLA